MCMESRTRRYNHYHHYLLIGTSKEQNLLGDVAVAIAVAAPYIIAIASFWFGRFEDVGIWSLAVVNVDMFPWIDRCV